MGRLRILLGREVCRILAQHGFVEVRRRGSHVVMQKKTGDTMITDPIQDYDEARSGTLQSIIRQSGLPRELFEN